MANLGNYAGLLSLADSNKAAGRVASTYSQDEAVRQAATQNTIGKLGSSAVASNPYAADNGTGSNWKTGMATAEKAGGLLGGGSGLGRVLGLVKLFI